MGSAVTLSPACFSLSRSQLHTPCFCSASTSFLISGVFADTASRLRPMSLAGSPGRGLGTTPQLESLRSAAHSACPPIPLKSPAPLTGPSASGGAAKICSRRWNGTLPRFAARSMRCRRTGPSRVSPPPSSSPSPPRVPFALFAAAPIAGTQVPSRAWDVPGRANRGGTGSDRRVWHERQVWCVLCMCIGLAIALAVIPGRRCSRGGRQSEVRQSEETGGSRRLRILLVKPGINTVEHDLQIARLKDGSLPVRRACCLTPLSMPACSGRGCATDMWIGRTA